MLRRPSIFILSAVLGMSMSISTTALGDDTEIYTAGASGREVIRPNVLLVLDTSDSMNALVPDTGVSRLENMRVAMVGLLENLDNVNVGLMRFNGHRNPNNPDPYVATGGPIIFPIANLDDEVSTIPGETDSTKQTVTVGVSDANDDAYEDEDGVVKLSDLSMVMGERLSEEIVATISAPTDDGYQERAGDVPSLSGGDTQSDRVVLARTDYIGLRYQNIDIPNGATILRADIGFSAKFNQAGHPTDVRFHGILHPALSTFAHSSDNIEGRPLTTGFVDWGVPGWVANESYTSNTTSPDLTTLVQEIVDQTGWTSGNPMGFRIEDLSSTDVSSRRRAAKSFDNPGDGPTTAPRLTVEFESESELRTGVRFSKVSIPQGATITGAYLDFQTADPVDNSDDANYAVHIEYEDDAVAYTDASHDLSSRNWSTPNTVWYPPDVISGEDQTFTTPDLKSLVQNVVDRPGWCGGNALSFSLVGAGQRAIKTFDTDPTKAPVLRVTFDTSSIAAGGGCNQKTQSFQTEHSKDDAVELETGAMSLGGSLTIGSRNDAGDPNLVGLRFPGVAVPEGAEVEHAVLEFVARAASSSAVTVNIHGDAGASMARFENVSSSISDTTFRSRSTASVSWTPEAVVSGQIVQSADVTDIVKEITDSSGSWRKNNSMGFYLSRASGTGLRSMHSYNTSAFKAPRLRVTWKETFDTTGSGATTVRQRLIELTNQQIYTLNRTPTIETLYEAALYWRGGDVVYGKQRGVQNDGMRYARVSHPGSYTGGTVTRPAGCTAENPNALACKGETITGSPQYVSPFGTQPCQTNYMVFLSDGGPTQNGSISEIESLLGTTCGANVKGNNGKCGNELLKHLYEVDQDTYLDGKQNVTTYSIGFNIGDAGNASTVEFMKDLAENGGGEFFSADTADQLTNVLSAIFTSILSKTTSFASPSLTVNAFNKLFTRDDAYFALFKPDATTRWSGNIKKYKICSDSSTGCTLGDLLDADSDSALGADSRIREDARSVWTAENVQDGSIIELGGAGDAMPNYVTRTLYTDYGVISNPDSPVALHDDAYKMTLSNYTDHSAFRTACSDPTVGNAECDALLLWMLGKHGANVDDVERASPHAGNRWAFDDPLHSSPVVVTYGGTSSSPIDKVFVGTNDGALRMINAATGKEEWAFMPKTHLSVQETLLANADGEHGYGIDMTPTIHVYDKDQDGKIEPSTDFVHLYVGMRRGGVNYYAFDITPTQTLTDDSAGGVLPKLMWRIEGGSGDYARLGQTWSRPKLMDIAFHNGTTTTTKTVLAFGGGYDPALDDAYGTAATGGNPNLGNAIYLVDAITGARIRWISNEDADINLPNMVHSIASDLAAMDSDGDSLIDRLYVGDLGGQVWRVDLGASLSASDNGGTSVGQLASIATAGTVADERKFLYPPDVVQVTDTKYSTNNRYDLVAITTGDRANPLEKVVSNRIYAFRDYTYGRMTDDAPDDNVDGVAEGYTLVEESAMLDVTDNVLQDGTTAEKTIAKAALQAAKGWYLKLEGVGEKGLSRPIVLGGKLFVTSYLPDESANACQAAEGAGLLYGLNVLDASAALDWDETTDATFSKADRTMALGSGIPSGAVPVFQQEGITMLVGSGGGATNVDPDLDLPRQRTYWFQH